jgi:GH25 family lysozyme M1 (1,4-beta-N-acetylmuramidase)
VNWDALKARGVRFAYMKATEGGTFKDSSFTKNHRGT